MGTSNWQNIPYCVEAILALQPLRVLDVGIGFGRWGIVLREFGDVWAGRVHRPLWKIRVEGIEAFPKNVDDYHRVFYDVIHEGDARVVIPTLPRDWDLVIFGDVLEHFEKEEGKRLLAWAVASSRYVMVNLPLGEGWEQDEAYDNPYERHLAAWSEGDVRAYPVRNSALFLDSVGRPFGSFLLSESDPAALEQRVFPGAIGGPAAVVDPTDADLVARVAALAAAANEFAQFRATGGYRFVEALKASPVARPLAKAGKVVLPAAGAIARAFRGGSAPAGAAPAAPASAPPAAAPAPSPVPPARGGREPSSTGLSAREFSVPERRWLEGAVGARSVGVCHPEWRGVRKSAGERHAVLLDLREELDDAGVRHAARLLLEAAPGAIVFEGFPATYGRVAAALRRLSPRTPLFAVWHGSFLHSGEDVAWAGFLALLEATRSGTLDRAGFVKKGMAEIVAASGVRTGFVMNLVRDVPKGASTPREGGPHLGIWGLGDSWKKPPFAMIAAAAAVPGAELHGSGASPRARELAAVLGVRERLGSEPVEASEMPRVLASMHLNLYVTLTECAPMLPLESLSVGVPCLLGPTSYYFEDDDSLRRALVVESPDSASAIAAAARAALVDRGGIVEAYRRWAPAHNERASRAFEEFLRGEPAAG